MLCFLGWGSTPASDHQGPGGKTGSTLAFQIGPIVKSWWSVRCDAAEAQMSRLLDTGARPGTAQPDSSWFTFEQGPKGRHEPKDARDDNFWNPLPHLTGPQSQTPAFWPP